MMAIAWQILDRFETDDEGALELRMRGKGDYLITVGSQILMNSKAQRSEMALGQLGCSKAKHLTAPRVLVGGLGMAITLRAVLDELPADAEVIVAELNPKIKEWCLDQLAELTDGAAADPRVRVHIGDVAELVKKSAPESFDAIIYDLYRGPHPKTDRRNDPLYGSRAIVNCRAALKKQGLFSIWGENPDPGFEKRLADAGFAVTCERPGKGAYRHAVWVAEKRVSQKTHQGQRPKSPSHSQ
jgi:spermidine synthase